VSLAASGFFGRQLQQAHNHIRTSRRTEQQMWMRSCSVRQRDRRDS